MSRFLTKHRLLEDYRKEMSKTHCSRHDPEGYMKYRSNQFLGDRNKKQRMVDGYQTINNRVDKLGFDHNGISFAGVREYRESYYSAYSLDDHDIESRPTSTTVKEFVIVLNEQASMDLLYAVETHEILERENTARISQEQKDEKSREQNATLKKAWENYQTIKKLLK